MMVSPSFGDPNQYEGIIANPPGANDATFDADAMLAQQMQQEENSQQRGGRRPGNSVATNTARQQRKANETTGNSNSGCTVM